VAGGACTHPVTLKRLTLAGMPGSLELALPFYANWKEAKSAIGLQIYP